MEVPEFLKHLLGQNKEFEAVCFAPDDFKKEMTECHKLRKTAVRIQKEYEARSELAWCKLRESMGDAAPEEMEYQPETGMIVTLKKKEATNE